MKHYEQILDKITPTFYKLTQYVGYFYSRYNQVKSYIDATMVSTPERNTYAERIHYKFYVHERYFSRRFYFDIELKEEEIEPIRINVTILYGHVEFITGMILNKFILDNEIVPGYNRSGKKLFIDLVGQDMYNTLKSAIK